MLSFLERVLKASPRILFFASLLALAACGGSGGGDGGRSGGSDAGGTDGGGDSGGSDSGDNSGDGDGDGGGSDGGENPDPPSPNEAPAASAGPDQSVPEGSMVTLSAAGSTDSDGSVIGFGWAQIGGPTVVLTGASGATASFSAVLTDAPVVLTFRVSVTDDDGASDDDTMTVVVNPSTPPVAEAGAHQTVVEREEVLLSAAASGDPDGTVEAYAWVQTSGPAVTLSAPDATESTFTAPVVGSTTDLTFEVTVTDDTEDGASDTVTITVLPNEPPALATIYPCDGCRFWGDALTVTGTAMPGVEIPEVAGLDDVSVTVDAGAGAVTATMLGGGWWLADNVPVDPAQKNLSVILTATDRFGETAQVDLALEQRPTLTGGYIATHPGRADVVYLLETSNPRGRLMELQPAADEITVIHQSEAQFTSGAVRVDVAGNRLLATTPGLDEVFGIDLTSGAITSVTGNGTGSGPDLQTPRGMNLDDAADRLIVVDSELEALFAVDPANGTRSIIADNAGIGTGTNLVEPRNLAVDSLTREAYVTQTPGTVLSIDMNTGNRTLVVNLAPLPSILSSVELDSDRGVLVLWSSPTDTLVRVDPDRGIMDWLSDPDTSGIGTGNAPEARIDVMGDRYLVNDLSPNFSSGDLDALVAVDRNSGAREIIYQDTVGTGERLDDVRNIALDYVGNRVYVVSAASVFSIDLSGGHRTLISGADRGAGTALANAVDLALDLANDRVFVLDRGTGSGAGVVAVDLATGDRSPISGPSTGAGPALDEVNAIILDAGADRLLIADDTLDAIVGVNIGTGDRSLFSAAGNGPMPLVTPYGMDLDIVGNRLLVADEGSGATSDIRIFGIDLVTGARSVISDSTGFGPPLSSARDVAAIQGGDLSIVAAQNVLMLIDGATGERLVMASDDAGTGESVANISKIAIDPLRPLAYGWSANFEALFQFNVLTGDRMVVSK